MPLKIYLTEEDEKEIEGLNLEELKSLSYDNQLTFNQTLALAIYYTKNNDKDSLEKLITYKENFKNKLLSIYNKKYNLWKVAFDQWENEYNLWKKESDKKSDDCSYKANEDILEYLISIKAHSQWEKIYKQTVLTHNDIKTLDASNIDALKDQVKLSREHGELESEVSISEPSKSWEFLLDLKLAIHFTKENDAKALKNLIINTNFKSELLNINSISYNLLKIAHKANAKKLGDLSSMHTLISDNSVLDYLISKGASLPDRIKIGRRTALEPEKAKKLIQDELELAEKTFNADIKSLLPVQASRLAFEFVAREDVNKLTTLITERKDLSKELLKVRYTNGKTFLYGSTLLMAAASKGSPETVNILLKLGANPFDRNQYRNEGDGNDAAMLVCNKQLKSHLTPEQHDNNALDILKSLLEKRKQEIKQNKLLNKSVIFNEKDLDGNTVFIEAARSGLIKCVEFLLKTIKEYESKNSNELLEEILLHENKSGESALTIALNAPAQDESESIDYSIANSLIGEIRNIGYVKPEVVAKIFTHAAIRFIKPTSKKPIIGLSENTTTLADEGQKIWNNLLDYTQKLLIHIEQDNMQLLVQDIFCKSVSSKNTEPGNASWITAIREQNPYGLFGSKVFTERDIELIKLFAAAGADLSPFYKFVNELPSVSAENAKNDFYRERCRILEEHKKELLNIIEANTFLKDITPDFKMVVPEVNMNNIEYIKFLTIIEMAMQKVCFMILKKEDENKISDIPREFKTLIDFINNHAPFTEGYQPTSSTLCSTILDKQLKKFFDQVSFTTNAGPYLLIEYIIKSGMIDHTLSQETTRKLFTHIKENIINNMIIDGEGIRIYFIKYNNPEIEKTFKEDIDKIIECIQQGGDLTKLELSENSHIWPLSDELKEHLGLEENMQSDTTSKSMDTSPNVDDAAFEINVVPSNNNSTDDTYLIGDNYGNV